MATLEGREVNILRIAGPNDAGFDGRFPKVFVGDPSGERLVLRSLIDETDDMDEADREAMDKALGKTEEQSRVDEIRRQARARGAPPDQTPAATIKLPSGREIPNPDFADANGGRAPTLEQDKAPVPTHPTGFQQGRLAVQDRGDPSQGMGGHGGDVHAQTTGTPARTDGDENQIEQDAQRQRDNARAEAGNAADENAARQKELEKQQEEARQKAEQENREKVRQQQAAGNKPGEGERVTDPSVPPPRDPNAAPPGTPEGLGEDQRKDRKEKEQGPKDNNPG